MGLFSSNSSSTQSTTNNSFDKRVAVDNEGFGLSGDANSLTITNNSTTTDAGAIQAASDATRLAIGTAGNALSLVSSMTNDGLSFADAIAAKNVTATKDALTFGSNSLTVAGTATKDALSFGATSLNVSSKTLTEAMSGALKSQDNVLLSNGQATKDAMTVATGATSQALSAISAANRESLAAVTANAKESVSAMGAVSTQSLSTLLQVNKDSLALADRSQGLVFNSIEDALGFSAHVVDAAFSSNKGSQDATANAINQVARAYDTATNYQAEKATTDSRYLVIAGLVVVALAALKLGVK